MPDTETASATTVRQVAVRNAIAGEVRAAVARKRRTLREVGEVIGVSYESARQRLNGNVPFGADELVLLSADLDVPVAQFFRTPAIEVLEVGAA